MAQFVSFSQHPTDPNIIMGRAQNKGSPATNRATTSPSWGSVLGGDGGYNAIDPVTPLNFYASNPDIPPEGLGDQLCANGVSCINEAFNFVVTSGRLDGDDGGFYFPYILDPGSSASMLIGTCRVWRGPRTGGVFSALSPNFDTLGYGTCSGSEVNQIRGLAAAGKIDSNGSGTIYATTSGYGPVEGPFFPRLPAGVFGLRQMRLPDRAYLRIRPIAGRRAISTQINIRFRVWRRILPMRPEILRMSR